MKTITQPLRTEGSTSVGVSAEVRAAQRSWATVDLQERLRIVRKIRNEIAVSATFLLAAFPLDLIAKPAERLASEIIPLAEACRFLERTAVSILAPRRLALKPRPFWLRGIEVEEHHDPLGVILIIGPSNYPLYLPGVQALQALVAGNAVMLKPGRAGAPVMRAFRELALRAGLPENLLIVLNEDASLVRPLLAGRVDKIILTGSVETGRAVYREAADHLIPLILELSGCDPVFVQAGADLSRAARAVAFATDWNDGQTCIAPKHIFVDDSVAEPFERLLREISPAASSIPITRFANEQDALEQAMQSPYALGATIFGEPAAARALAAKVAAGVVVVNDAIMPTADPRVAFGGRKQSGFGVTRGAEGLRECTVRKAVIIQKSSRLRHLEPLREDAAELFASYLSASYAVSWFNRLAGYRRLLRALRNSRRKI